MTYNFGETVVNATADGVVLAEGVGAFGGDLNVSIAGSGGSGPYVASVVPGEEGTFTVVVPTDAVQDLAANDCERSNVLTFRCVCKGGESAREGRRGRGPGCMRK